MCVCVCVYVCVRARIMSSGCSDHDSLLSMHVIQVLWTTAHLEYRCKKKKLNHTVHTALNLFAYLLILLCPLRTFTCTHTHTHSQTHMYTHSLIHTHVHTHSLIHTHVHTHTHSLTHTLTHTHTNTHTHTHTHTGRWFEPLSHPQPPTRGLPDENVLISDDQSECS